MPPAARFIVKAFDERQRTARWPGRLAPFQRDWKHRDGWKPAEILEAVFPLTGTMAENCEIDFFFIFLIFSRVC